MRRPRSRPTRPLLVLLFTACALLGGLASARVRASTVRALSLEALTQKAEVIVVGVPERAQTRRQTGGKLLVTDVTVHVERTLEGAAKPGASLVVTLLGGELDGVALAVPGEASLPLGGRALLFLQRAPRSRELRVVGMAQGVMPLETRPDGTVMVLPAGGGAALVDRGADGKLHEAPAALAQPEPAEALLARVQALVAEQAR